MVDVDLDSLDLSTKQQVIVGLWVVAVIAILLVTASAMGGGSGADPAAAADEPAADADEPAEMGGVSSGTVAPPESYQTLEGSTATLEEYRGDTVLLWFPMTDCETCQEEVQMMAANNSRLQNLTIVALPMGSAPDSGAQDPEAFAREFGPETVDASNWVWGTPSAEMVETYNPEHTHGLAYLVNESGVIVAKGSQPGSNIETITHFANQTTE